MTSDLTAERARRMRWHAQLLGGSALAPAEVVDRAVALQGQDLPAVLRAIALRSRPGTTLAAVREAFDDGLLVRSWPMRGTLFATTPRRLATLLHFTADRIHRAAARRRERLGLDDATLARARDALSAALAERPLRRSEALAAWEATGIDTSGGRGYHLIMHLAVDGLCWWEPFDAAGTEQFLALAAIEPPDDPDAALSDAVRGYVEARGPVTLEDLVWWTKLPKALLRRACTGADLAEVTVEGAPAWIVDPAPRTAAGTNTVTLLPGFEEWILGYEDRALVADPAALAALVPGNNGVFRPAVLVDGIVAGTWRPPSSARRAEVAFELVEAVPAAVRRAVKAAVEAQAAESTRG